MQLSYFYEPSVFSVHALVALSADTSKHCIQVLRMREGDKLQLINGKGSLYTAVIVAADKRNCTVRIEESNYTPPPQSHLCVALSLLKNASRFEWFLEKAVEIGVQEIIPLLCERTEKQQYKAERFQQIVISAMLQSRQVWLPKLHGPESFNEVVNGSEPFHSKLIAHCVDDSRKTRIGASSGDMGRTQILIGPEGDFTRKEIALALELDYQPVSLGDTRLRTETAGVVASALLLHNPK